MVTPLLTTKLYIPPVRPELVSRPRLIERLNAGLHHKLTLISAPAGFGKTTLLSEWVVDCGRPVAWLSLDADDNDPARFLAYLVAALQTLDESIGKGALDVLQSPQPPALETLITTLINQINTIPGTGDSPSGDLASRFYVLVLDDYHLITAQPIHDALAFLLDYLPPQMHLVIATRADPPLPIARLRGRGQLTELRQTDLRFTSGEAMEFLNQVMGLKLEANEVAALASRTEGWIAGLQMAALSMQSHEDVSRFIAEFTGSQHYILDYLIEEVFQRQPESVQSFLLQTSILERMSGPLCDAVTGTGNSHAMLEHLEHANLFVFPLDDNRNWYRYHILFADLLRHRLLEVQPDLVPTLHRRASEWYERNGQMAEAIDHALLAKDFERAANLIERAADATMMRSEVATFQGWVEALPDDMARARPLLYVYHAWALLLSGHPMDVAQARLQEAEKADMDGSAAGAIAVFHALLAVYQGDWRASAELAQRALALLPEESLFLRSLVAGFLSVGFLWRGEVVAAKQALEEAVRVSQKAGNLMNAVLALSHLGEVSIMQGQLGKAKTLYEQALALATDQGRRQPIAGLALIGLGHLLYMRDDLEAAMHHYTEGIELVKRWGEPGALNGYSGLARLKQAQGDEEGARAAIQKALQIAAKFDAMKLDDLVVAIQQAQLWIRQGDIEAAWRWAEECGLDEEANSHKLAKLVSSAPSPVLCALEYMTLAQACLAKGQPDKALAILRPLIEIAEKAGWIVYTIEMFVLESLAWQEQGDVAQAMLSLERALLLAEREGIVRVFVDEGAPMARLLRQAASRGIVPAYVSKLLAAFAEETKDQRRGTEEVISPSVVRPASLVEPLSERELEVLRLLATELSSTDIAQELVVSVNTVRSHIKSIYSKLDVHSRYGAVARAKGLNLL